MTTTASPRQISYLTDLLTQHTARETNWITPAAVTRWWTPDGRPAVDALATLTSVEASELIRRLKAGIRHQPTREQSRAVYDAETAAIAAAIAAQTR